MSSQPSPSASRKAHPAPIVSGSHFLPVRPALWVNLMPAAAVTSVKPTGSAGGGAAAPHSRNALSIVIVNRLPLIVVLGSGQTRLLRQRLRRFVRFESAEELLFPVGLRALSQPTIAKHQVIVRLKVLGIDGERLLKGVDGLRVAPLEEENAPHLVGRDTVARILAAGLGQAAEGAVIVPGGLLGHGEEELGARQFGRERQRFLEVWPRRLGLALLNERPRDVDEAVG